MWPVCLPWLYYGYILHHFAQFGRNIITVFTTKRDMAEVEDEAAQVRVNFDLTRNLIANFWVFVEASTLLQRLLPEMTSKVSKPSNFEFSKWMVYTCNKD